MYYFASDMHLGSPHGRDTSMNREREIVRWLDAIAHDAKGIYLVGDVFDFWFEYKKVIPRGFTRFLGKLGELSDRGVDVHLFMGNHDMWMTGYLTGECGVTLHRRGEVVELYGKRIYIAHGDAITDRTSLLSRVRGLCLRSSTLRWLFSRFVHPTLALRFGTWWSGHSRETGYDKPFGGEAEALVQFARGQLLSDPGIDYFVFGHIHTAENYDLGDGKRVLFTGDWLTGSDYVRFTPDGVMELRRFLY